jgi:hypothetical protein
MNHLIGFNVWYKCMSNIRPHNDQSMVELDCLPEKLTDDEINSMIDSGLFAPIDDQFGLFIIPF